MRSFASLMILLCMAVPAPAEDGVERRISQLERELRDLRSQVQSRQASRPSANAFNPSITAFGDFTGRLDNQVVSNDAGNRVSNRLLMREFELDFRAAVDPYADAVGILAVEQEATGAAAAIALEEGYINVKDLPGAGLPRGMSLRLGKFRTSFGILNRLHLHDLPQTTLPLPVQTFLGEEGYAEFGAGVNYVKPLKKLGTSLTLTGEFLNGTHPTLFAGHASSRDPAYLGRARYSADLSGQSFYELGASYLVGNSDTDGKQTTGLLGADMLYKWRVQGEPRRWSRLLPVDLWSLVAQMEYFYMNREETVSRNAWGGYGLVQLQPSQRWYVGGRYDVTQNTANKSNKERKAGGWISFYTTEFLRLRLGYEYHNLAPGQQDRSTVYGQVTFVYGAHPAEPYWFSK